MGRVKTTIHVHQTIERVFDFVTTPRNWPLWHPSSLGVDGATDHSLEPGESVTERFRVAGRRGSVVWTVLKREAPRLWTIEGRVGDRGSGRISYTLTPHDGGTLFERDFSYSFSNPLLSLMDRLVLRRRIAAESAEALRRLKAVLEAPGVEG